MSSELELLALAVALFLYDSTVLLYANEAILCCDRRRVWHVSMGWNGILVAGRRVCVLNPFTMYRPCAKLRWNLYAADASNADEAWSEELPTLRVIAPWTVAAALALFVILPVGLFTAYGTYAILPAVSVLYLGILVALLLVRRRSALPALTGSRFAGLAFECLACPPFGINLIRRVALMRRVHEPLLSAAARLLPACERDALRAHCVAILDDEIGRLEELSNRRQSLEEQRALVSAWMRDR